MNRKTDSAYLKHILDCITDCQKHTKSISEEYFYKDELIHTFVIHKIQIIGEAANQLSDEFKESHPEIPWFKVVGMRNKIVHDYLEVDLNAVWDTLKKDLPELKKHLQIFV